ncbi:MAG: hypothetical protein Kow00124_31630 [Anaerolineae bacterium]
MVEQALAIRRVPELAKLVDWIESFRAAGRPAPAWRPPRSAPPANGSINPSLIDAIADALRQQRHRERGGWINCSCANSAGHKHGDRHPSFGFNTTSGYGYCYVCGSMLAKDLCDLLGIDPAAHGGLLRAPRPAGEAGRPRALSIAAAVEPPLPPPDAGLPPLGEIALPDWLSRYTDWAAAAGNQTPLIYHQAAGIWLLAVAIARRLVVQAPWGLRLYPNFYMMFVADTTYYRKTTAFKLAEGVIREAIPHLLMPIPGSPERFQDALSGRLHVQGLKLATVLAALDWMGSGRPAPVIEAETWALVETLTEHWRASAHRLLEQLDRGGAGREERRQQDRVLAAIRAVGPEGIALRRMYRNLNLRSADARQIVGELQRDGQVLLTTIGSAEACVYAGYGR